VIASVLYLVFVSVNFTTLHKMYGWVGKILDSVGTAAEKLDDPEQKTLKEVLTKVNIPGGMGLGYAAYIIAFIAVLYSIWF
jgi:hypothetical protein